MGTTKFILKKVRFKNTKQDATASFLSAEKKIDYLIVQTGFYDKNKLVTTVFLFWTYKSQNRKSKLQDHVIKESYYFMGGNYLGWFTTWQVKWL